MRFALALLCMFVAVGTPEDWPLVMACLWGILWATAAVVIAWPLTVSPKDKEGIK